jgi:flagellar assembly factor FliW
MLIKSAVFGEQNIDPDTVIHFQEGLPGFEDCKHFKLFHQESENPVIFWLQSLESPEIVFSVTDPALVGIHYEFTLTDAELELLGNPNAPENLLIAILLYKDEASEAIQGSIKAPLVIDCKSLKGLQKMLLDIEPVVTIKDKAGAIEFKAR